MPAYAFRTHAMAGTPIDVFSREDTGQKPVTTGVVAADGTFSTTLALGHYTARCSSTGETADAGMLAVSSASPHLNVRDYGAIGNGITDDVVAIRAAITAARSAGGGVVYFPPGVYSFSGNLDLTASASITLLGDSNMDILETLSLPSRLKYTGSGSTPAISFGSSRGFAIEGLSVVYSNTAFTGRLVDGQKLNPGTDTTYTHFDRVQLSMVGAATNTASMLLCLDGSHDVLLQQVVFQGGTYGLVGKLTPSMGATGGWAINVTLLDCSFNLQTTACIKNADESWDINATFEPLLSGRVPAAYVHDAGFRARGVTFRSCWAGDALGGTWITWSGDGLTILGGTYYASQLTKILVVDENATHGISFVGVCLLASNSISLVDYGSTSGHTGFSVIGGYLGSFQTPYVGLPPGSITQDGGNVKIDSLRLTGGLAVNGALAATGDATVASASIVPPHVTNLLTANQSRLEEGTTSGWLDNSGNSVLTVGTNAWEGAYSLAVASRLAGPVAVFSSPKSFPVVVGETYTAFAYCKPASTPRSYRLSLLWSDVAGVALGGSPISADVLGVVGTWVQVNVTGTPPTDAAQACLVLQTVASGAQGEVHYFDGVQLALGTSLTFVAPGASPPLLQFVSTVPTSNPPVAGSMCLYLDAGQLKARKSDGTIATLVA